MKRFKEPLSRIADWADSNETNFLYAIPVIGGIKSYRMREQARLLGHASDNLDEISYRKYYKLRSIIVPVAFEATKIGTLIVTAYGLAKLNPSEFVLGGVGYGFSSKIQSDITPKVHNLNKGREI